jgi:type II secretory pathway pseudopilin PulG
MRLSHRGLTLAELLLASAILAFALVGLLALFVNCLFLNETNRNLTLAYSAIQAKMEELKNVSFTDLNTYNGITFNLNGFSSGRGSGKITVSSEGGATNLKRIRIVACFMSGNKLVGDSLSNCQNSPAELVTLIVR